MAEFDIQEYMNKGVERVVSEAVRATLKNPEESIFMGKFALASKKASKRRAEFKKEGTNVPPFLIASITSSCNLHCAGCYSRCTQGTVDSEPVDQMTSEEWSRVFDEASDIGVSFILLAGGEPLIRKDVIKEASTRQNILFPIFTNGTFMDESYIKLFSKNRNLMPVMSIEGDKETTDSRRGEGVYERITTNMEILKKKGIIFGVSVTVTTENLEEVSSKEFLNKLSDMGCKLIIYVEFVPVSDERKDLAPGDKEREIMVDAISKRREEFPEMVIVSFPGDEKSSGGCIAAGRGFFHINSHGGAEPCPFSPYSDINVRDSSLKEAINSKLFITLRDEGYLLEDHDGGCVLYEKRAEVEKIING